MTHPLHDEEMIKELKEHLKQTWDYVYGKKSETNLLGKIILGIPFSPFIFLFSLQWFFMDYFFTKKEAKK